MHARAVLEVAGTGWVEVAEKGFHLEHGHEQARNHKQETQGSGSDINVSFLFFHRCRSIKDSSCPKGYYNSAQGGAPPFTLRRLPWVPKSRNDNRTFALASEVIERMGVMGVMGGMGITGRMGEEAKRRVRAAAAERTVLKHQRRLGATPKTVRSAAVYAPYASSILAAAMPR